MSPPLTTIVVVTSDRTIDLRRCLGLLRVHLQDPALGASEVITVHSPNDHAAMEMVRAEFPEVHVHKAPARHISVQRNLGARCARGEVIVYLDDDAWPHDGWLREVLTAFADARVLAASGPVFRGDGSLQCERLAASAIGRLVPLQGDQPTPVGMAPSFSGCNLALRRSALFACGGFDENLPYQPDDMDLCRRLFEHAGCDADAFCYRPGAAVTHESSPGPYRKTLEDRAWFVVARDNLYFACRHAGAVKGALGGMLLQVPKLLRFCRWLLAGKLGPLAFARCVGKHTAGVVAGLAKGLTRGPVLPLAPLPAPDAHPGDREQPAREEATPCRRTQPV